MSAADDFFAAWDKYLTAHCDLERCNIARLEARQAVKDAEFAHQEAKYAYIAARRTLLTLCPSEAFAAAIAADEAGEDK